MAESRRAATTEHIRNVAIANILATGVKAFSLNAVASEAFVSIGTVYERWENKTAALNDLAEHVIGPALDDLLASVSGLDIVDQQRFLFTNDAALQTQQLLVELLFASHDDADVLPATSDVIERYVTALQKPLGESQLACALAVWSASTLLGNALLHLGGARVPDLGDEVAQGVLRASMYVGGGVLRSAPNDVSGLVPEVPRAPELDSTGERLREATRTALTASALASTRDVANLAGVTTGALYRRFGSKSELINDALITELQPGRYEWASELIRTWQLAQNTDEVADVLSTQFIASLANTAQVNMLLHITSQARSDTNVRSLLVGQVENVAASRELMFAAVHATGVFEPFVTPRGQAWLLQATPTGARLLHANGLGPTPESLTLAIRALAASFITTETN